MRTMMTRTSRLGYETEICLGRHLGEARRTLIVCRYELCVSGGELRVCSAGAVQKS